MSEEVVKNKGGRPKGTMTSFASAHQARERGQAHRLAAADFLYGLSPDESANMMRIGDATAARLRETKWYKVRYAYLEAKIENVDEEIAKESKRLKMALGELVPRSIEVLKEHLWANQRTDQFKAAQEVLDRDGRLPKVSKTQNVAPSKELPAPSESLMAEFAEPKPN